jgi:hypothetical protein
MEGKAIYKLILFCMNIVSERLDQVLWNYFFTTIKRVPV